MRIPLPNPTFSLTNVGLYLKANTDTLMSRINNRQRSYEADISSEYIHSLNIYYNKWITNNSRNFAS